MTAKEYLYKIGMLLCPKPVLSITLSCVMPLLLQLI